MLRSSRFDKLSTLSPSRSSTDICYTTISLLFFIVFIFLFSYLKAMTGNIDLAVMAISPGMTSQFFSLNICSIFIVLPVSISIDVFKYIIFLVRGGMILSHSTTAYIIP